jgi:hypothetical protein
MIFRKIAQNVTKYLSKLINNFVENYPLKLAILEKMSKENIAQMSKIRPIWSHWIFLNPTNQLGVEKLQFLPQYRRIFREIAISFGSHKFRHIAILFGIFKMSPKISRHCDFDGTFENVIENFARLRFCSRVFKKSTKISRHCDFVGTF